LRERLVTDEMERISEIKSCLLHMPDFYHFMMHHGECAFSLIKDEYLSEIMKYSNRVDQKPYFAPLIAALNVEKLQSKFSHLCDEMGVLDQRYQSSLSFS